MVAHIKRHLTPIFEFAMHHAPCTMLCGTNRDENLVRQDIWPGNRFQQELVRRAMFTPDQGLHDIVGAVRSRRWLHTECGGEHMFQCQRTQEPSSKQHSCGSQKHRHCNVAAVHVVLCCGIEILVE